MTSASCNVPHSTFADYDHAYIAGPTVSQGYGLVQAPDPHRVIPGVPCPKNSPTRNSHRRVVMTTCQAHGAAGFTNLLMTKEDGAVVLNPHLANCCVLRLDERDANDLHKILGEWLG